MKRALYALIIGTVLSGCAAAYASAHSRSAQPSGLPAAK
ncbi:hypothetical protein FHT02_000797 [Sphingomonas xinjiangensis]|uniref:Lipoprotein n=1 Tax=Sphingomonas xinjiangensis TaxID=643568 RepID=A0A840YBB2_9SPHN|nr:hypothetical protein [Sphingomonas xinjiangensis]